MRFNTICLVILSSGQFTFDGVDMYEYCDNYMKMLDEDKDGLVSFTDFITPLMPILPTEVALMFTQDHRFKQSTFNDMRIVFDQVSKVTEGEAAAEIEDLRAKLEEMSRKDLSRQFENMIKLLGFDEAKKIK